MDRSFKGERERRAPLVRSRGSPFPSPGPFCNSSFKPPGLSLWPPPPAQDSQAGSPKGALPDRGPAGHGEGPPPSGCPFRAARVSSAGTTSRAGLSSGARRREGHPGAPYLGAPRAAEEGGGQQVRRARHPPTGSRGELRSGARFACGSAATEGRRGRQRPEGAERRGDGAWPGRGGERKAQAGRRLAQGRGAGGTGPAVPD